MGRLGSSTNPKRSSAQARNCVSRASTPATGCLFPGGIAMPRRRRFGAGPQKERCRMCPSPGSRFRPWSTLRLPTLCLVQYDSGVADLMNVLDRTEAVRQTRQATCIIGNRVPAKGRRWIATFRRGPFPSPCCLSVGCGRVHAVWSAIASSRVKRNSVLPPPHPVKHGRQCAGPKQWSRASCHDASPDISPRLSASSAHHGAA